MLWKRLCISLLKPQRDKQTWKVKQKWTLYSFQNKIAFIYEQPLCLSIYSKWWQTISLVSVLRTINSDLITFFFFFFMAICLFYYHIQTFSVFVFVFLLYVVCPLCYTLKISKTFSRSYNLNFRNMLKLILVDLFIV